MNESLVKVIVSVALVAAFVSAACGTGSASEGTAADAAVSNPTRPAVVTWDTADLGASADVFSRSLASNDMPTLIRMFTPEGIASATALQGQLTGTDTTVSDVTYVREGAHGGEELIRFVVQAAGAKSTLMTRWMQLDGAWKVNAIMLGAE